MTVRLHTVILATLALAVPIIYWPGIFDFTLHPRLFAIQIGLLIGALFVAFRLEFRLSYSPIILPLLAWTTWSTLSALWAINPVESLVQINRTITFSLLTLFILCTPGQDAIRKIYGFACGACILVSIVGIAQYFGLAFTNLPTVGNPSSTFGYRNFAASYLVACIPFAMAFAKTSPSKFSRATWTLSALLMTLFLAYTRTRGAWLGLALATAVSASALIILRFYHNRSLIHFTLKQLAIITACMILIGIGGSMPAQMEREGKFRFDERKTDVTTTLASTFSPNDARGRLTVWLHTLEMIRDHPIFGVGIGSWQYTYPLYDRGDWITDNVAPQRPHNDLLWIFAETGLVGIGLYLWLIFTLFRLVWQHLLHRPDHPTAIWILGIAVGLLALIGHSCFSFPKERIAPSFMFWLGVGAIALLTSRTQCQPHRRAWALSIPLLFCGLTLTYNHLRFDVHYLQTHNAWHSENWSHLVSQANAALQWGPFNHRIFLLQGLAFQKQGNYKRAAQAYHNAQRYHPNDGHAALGSVYASLGDTKRAVDHYRLESLLYPKLATTALNLGDALLAAGNASEAIVPYRRATTLSPTLFNAWLGLGNAHQINADWTAARIAYETARTLNPDHPPVHNNLGAVLTQLHRYTEAEAAYHHALKLNTNYARVYHNLGDLYAARGDTINAIAAYQTFIRIWQGDIRFSNLAQTKIQNLQSKP